MQQIAVYACINRCRANVRLPWCRAQARCSVLERDARVLLDSSNSVRTQSRDVTRGDGVDLLAGGSWRDVQGALIDRLFEVRGFSSVVLRRVQSQSREHPSSVRDKSRERPSLMVSGGRVENIRAFDRSEDREHPSLLDSERKSREYPCYL